MFHSTTITNFLFELPGVQLLDVRTPAEFVHGHIPGARNLPLFSNEERVLVGTTYKQQGKEPAILLGFDLTGAKWSHFIRQALEIAPGKKVAVHCWRGGMRSAAMAWALDLYGFDVYVIAGGYKSYRRWVYQQFERKYRIRLVGGMTGSGKTKILHELKDRGEQILDLEGLACHQGSVYGSMNRHEQPSQEQFENDLGLQLSRLEEDKILWIEDESINIGRCQIPKALWNQMLGADLVNIQVPAEFRVPELVREYGSLDKNFLIDCTQKIRKRLGPEQCKSAVTAISEDRMEDFVRQVLIYYDKTYTSGLHTRSPDQVTTIEAISANHADNAIKVLAAVRTQEQYIIPNQSSSSITIS